MAEKPTLVKVGELILDFTLYPRATVDSQHVHYMRAAQEAGVEFPPIIADAKSKRVIDGFHRVSMYLKAENAEYETPVILREYPSEAAMFLAAVTANATHGRTLTTFDRTRCVLRAEELEIDREQIAGALSLTVAATDLLRTDRVGKLRATILADNGSRSPREVPIKRTIRHMAGRTLTKAQHEANDRLSGMDQLFYVNQIVTLIENDLLDRENERLMRGLEKLQGLLEGVVLQVV